MLAADRVRAAQYLRMSTEEQVYSISNQAAAIADYAAAHGFEVVRTYQDAGRSGVVLRNGEGLKRLLADVLSGNTDFDAVLLYDVSRWGRLSASPDLAIRENEHIKLVKLGVTKDGDNPEVVRIMLRVIYQAAATRFRIDPRDVVYFDIANAARIHGSNDDSALAATIDNGCDALTEMC